jgi:hypothetical protein
MNRDPMQHDIVRVPNGAALAAVLAAGIGAFALGVLVILNEAGVFSAPSLYAPTGGLSGRSALSVIAWLAAWGILHARWRKRDVAARRVLLWVVVLVALAVALTFPPLWELLPGNA